MKERGEHMALSGHKWKLGVSIARCKVAAALPLLIFLGLTACSQLVDGAAGRAIENLRLSIHTVSVKLSHSESPRLLVSILIENVNPDWVEIHSLELVAYVDGREFYRGELPRDGEARWQVEGERSVGLEVALPITRELLLQLAAESMKGARKKRELTVDGSVRFGTPFGAHEHEFRTKNVFWELSRVNLYVEFPPLPQFIPVPSLELEL